MKVITPSSQPVNVAVGESVTVELPGVPTAGYEWSLRHGPELKSKSVGWAAPSAGNAIGGASRQRFEIAATREGNFEIECIYKRAWEDKIEKRSILHLQAG
jgi:predicted secreted protein